MTEESLSLSISIFKNEGNKDQAIQLIKSMHKDNARIVAAIAINKEISGEIHYKDIGMSPTKGAFSGLVLGAVAGVLTGGIGLVLGSAGALIGGLVGSKKYQERFSEVRLHEVVAALEPGSSAIVAVVQRDSLLELEKNMANFDAEFFKAELSDDLAEKLEQGGAHEDNAAWFDQFAK